MLPRNYNNFLPFLWTILKYMAAGKNDVGANHCSNPYSLWFMWKEYKESDYCCGWIVVELLNLSFVHIRLMFFCFFLFLTVVFNFTNNPLDLLLAYCLVVIIFVAVPSKSLSKVRREMTNLLYLIQLRIFEQIFELTAADL